MDLQEINNYIQYTDPNIIIDNFDANMVMHKLLVYGGSYLRKCPIVCTNVNGSLIYTIYDIPKTRYDRLMKRFARRSVYDTKTNQSYTIMIEITDETTMKLKIVPIEF